MQFAHNQGSAEDFRMLSQFRQCSYLLSHSQLALDAMQTRVGSAQRFGTGFACHPVPPDFTLT